MNAGEILRILELPKNIYDKIAAGEVVDRPLSIVKELVENSIDAGASSIVVEIKNGGKSYIRVTDNGSGIEKEDVELAFKRHATSKIKNVADLDHINSLGFRGEALASISAVSRVELITKTASVKSGIRVKVEGGELLEKEDTGCPEGTTILVEDLFFNTPARLKFMKPDATESTLIIDFISKMTLAYPEIKIRLINNGNILFSTPGKGDIYANILTIYSKETGDKLIHLREDGPELYLEAFISAPNNSKTNRKSQIFFVNGRFISSKILENAITDAYQEKLFEGRYPIVFLFLKVNPEKLDVNIHPNKKEVRFDDERLVRDFVAAAIRKNLQTKDAIPEIKEKNIFQFQNSAGGNSTTVEPRRSNELGKSLTAQHAKTEKYQKVEEQVDIKKLLSIQRETENIQKETSQRESNLREPENKINHAERTAESTETYRVGSVSEAAINPSMATPNPNPSIDSKLRKPAFFLLQHEELTIRQDFDIRSLTVTGSIFGTYITAVDENSFYLIDQHAAHERIFYEQLLDAYINQEKAQQMILTPVVINVTHAVKNDTGEMMDFIRKMGFEIEEFGPSAYLMKAIPVFMELDEAKEFIDFILDNISEESDLENQKKIAKIITTACKKSVKAHDVLDRREIERLMADLAKTKNPYSCPHGRPTFIRLKQYEIEKMFKRV